MDAASWISLLVVIVVPVLAISRTGRRWFVSAKSREYVWGFLATLAVMGVALVMFRGTERLGAGVLVATPLLQAIVFVVADKLFQLSAGRTPVPFDEARRGHRVDGGRHWVDTSFWVVVFLGLLVGAVFLCGSFGIEFPSRSGR